MYWKRLATTRCSPWGRPWEGPRGRTNMKHSWNGKASVPRCNACSNKLFPNEKDRKMAKRKNFRNGEASVTRCSASLLRGRIRTHPHELPLAIAFIVLRTGTDWLRRPQRRPPKTNVARPKKQEGFLITVPKVFSS